MIESSSIPVSRTGIVVCACCDAPAEFLAQPNVIIIPIPIRIGNNIYIDHHDLQDSARYIREITQKRCDYGKSEPMIAEQMRDFFLKYCALHFDQIYCLTISSNISPIYAEASQGLDMALGDIRKLRHEANINRPFVCRMVDVQNLFAGEGIAALLLQGLLKQPLHSADMFKKLIKEVGSIQSYITVDDIAYARYRISSRGDHSLNSVSMILGKMLNIKPMVRNYHGRSEIVGKFRGRSAVLSQIFTLIIEHVVMQRLKTPNVIISHSDALREIYGADKFSQLRTACEVNEVNLHIVPMSVSGIMNLGVGAVSVAFAADIDKFTS